MRDSLVISFGFGHFIHCESWSAQHPIVSNALIQPDRHSPTDAFELMLIEFEASIGVC